MLYGVDTRAHEEIKEMEKELGADTLFELSRVKLSSQSVTPKILWIKKHCPDVWKNTRYLLTASGYLTWKMTGKRVQGIYDAISFPGLFDVEKGCWTTRYEDYLAPVSMLPELMWNYEIAGHINQQTAEETGLVEGTPVLPGCADAAAEALSAGLSQPGDMMLMYGSSTFLYYRLSSCLRLIHFGVTTF